MTIHWTSDLGQRIRKELADELVVWMTTTSHDGTPQPNPVWFVTDGDDVIVYSHKTAARNMNVARNPHVALNFNSDPHADRMSVIIGQAAVDENLPMPEGPCRLPEEVRASHPRHRHDRRAAQRHLLRADPHHPDEDPRLVGKRPVQPALAATTSGCLGCDEREPATRADCTIWAPNVVSSAP